VERNGVLSFAASPHRTSLPLLTALILASSFANASVTLGPDSWIEVQLRGNSADYVLRQLKTAATANGMTCIRDASGNPACQFESTGYFAIQPSTGPQVVSIFFVYRANDSPDPDPVRQRTIDLVVHQFVNSVRQSNRVSKIVLCDLPPRGTGLLCEGRMLLDRRAKP
jgi:hypothetical protein